MQIKTTVRYQYTLLERPKSRTLATSNAGEHVRQQELSLIAGGSEQWYSHFGRQFCVFLQNETFSYRIQSSGFPGGAVVESLPANAGGTGSSPGLGGSHMPRSSWAREPQLLSLRVWSLCSAAGEAAMVRGPRTAMKSGPRLPKLEKALEQRRRPNTAINK